MERNAVATRKQVSRRGFTIVELIIVLFIVLVLIVGAFYQFRKVNNERKLKEEASFMTMLFIEIQRLYSNQPNYTGLSSDILIRTGMIPEDRVKDGKIVNKFGGYIDVKPSDGDVGFTVSYDNIPKQVCVQMALASKNISNLVSITINGMELPSREAITVDNVAKGCTEEDDNKIEITAR